MRLKNNEAGMASIIITLVIVIIIAIIVSGSLLTVRRSQRLALDRQLSTQAFYAAESGVNDAIKALQNGYTGYDGDANGNKTHCNPDQDSTSPLSGNVNQLNGSSVLYTCLLINSNPTNASYTVAENPPVNITLNTNTPITNLIFTWKADSISDANQRWDGMSTNFYPDFPSSSAWNANGKPMIGVLRAAITNLDCSNSTNGCYQNNSGSSFGPFTRTSLDNDTYTAYFYPNPPGGSPTLVCGDSAGSPSSPGNGFATYIDNTFDYDDQRCQGQIMKASCGSITPNTCTMNVNVTNANSRGTRGTPLSKHFFVRLSSIYLPSDVSIVAKNGSTTVPFVNTQIIIDSTGKAQDVLRRIQVRASFNGVAIQPPAFAVQAADGICKSMQLTPIKSFIDSNPVCTW